MTIVFDTEAPIDPHVLAKAVALVKALPPLENGETIEVFYTHWTGGCYTGGDAAYNLSVVLDDAGTDWDMIVSHSPLANARQIPPDAQANVDYAAHTYGRNSHALGFTVDAMFEATPHDFGKYPVQLHQLEHLCAMVAAAGAAYHVDVADANTNMTHAEAAILDGYFITDEPDDGVTRWDLERFTASETEPSKGEAKVSGQELRRRAHLYKLAILEALK